LNAARRCSTWCGNGASRWRWLRKCSANGSELPVARVQDGEADEKEDGSGEEASCFHGAGAVGFLLLHTADSSGGRRAYEHKKKYSLELRNSFIVDVVFLDEILMAEDMNPLNRQYSQKE
jgi:hypothetical protein